MNRRISSDSAVRSALISAQMEGFRITPKIESDCKKIVRGEISVADYISQVKIASAPKKRMN